MADIVLINPRFEISFWGLEHVLPIMGKRANMPVGSLPLLAALTPAPHQVTLIDENVEAIDFERVARADIVGLTGQIVQRFRMRCKPLSVWPTCAARTAQLAASCHVQVIGPPSSLLRLSATPRRPTLRE